MPLPTSASPSSSSAAPYKDVSAAQSAVDAKSMAKLFRSVGFDVVEGSNLNQDDG